MSFNFYTLQALPRMGLIIGVRSITVPADYVQCFTIANETFLYQSVFNVSIKKETTLTAMPEHIRIQNKTNYYLYPLLFTEFIVIVASLKKSQQFSH